MTRKGHPEAHGTTEHPMLCFGVQAVLGGRGDVNLLEDYHREHRVEGAHGGQSLECTYARRTLRRPPNHDVNTQTTQTQEHKTTEQQTTNTNLDGAFTTLSEQKTDVEQHNTTLENKPEFEQQQHWRTKT